MIKLFSKPSNMAIHKQKRQVFVARLLAWGTKNRRDFPWRQSSNPFHILIAELMLQRTIASQVEPVYIRFVTKYDSLLDLSKASLEDIAKDLQSLGLAYRALRLKQITDMIMTEFGGSVPLSEDELLQLPGVGRYVANAVLCFAYKKDVPLVDVNVLRVMKRVFSITISKESHKKPEMWKLMSTLIPRQKAREFNLSILDFASLICTARNPLHETCPLKDICAFYQKRARTQENTKFG